MADILNFHPAPRPMWILFHWEESATFALMPGWVTIRNDEGSTWPTLTWQNPHNFEAEPLDVDDHFLLRLWDSATHTPPSLDDVLAELHAQRQPPTAEQLEQAERDYRIWFPAPPRTAAGDNKPPAV
ncbi:hypothetical protein ACIQWB_35240 [Streptomyces olivaceus]|uniref:hypothetical protein n=1 Tax=Streptomyces olivaceus TaxID=47716 RepID=UPI003803E7B1